MSQNKFIPEHANSHVGYSHTNECWFVRFYGYATEEQAKQARAQLEQAGGQPVQPSQSAVELNVLAVPDEDTRHGLEHFQRMADIGDDRLQVAWGYIMGCIHDAQQPAVHSVQSDAEVPREWQARWFGSEPLKGAHIWDGRSIVLHVGETHADLVKARNIAKVHNLSLARHVASKVAADRAAVRKAIHDEWKNTPNDPPHWSQNLIGNGMQRAMQVIDEMGAPAAQPADAVRLQAENDRLREALERMLKCADEILLGPAYEEMKAQARLALVKTPATDERQQEKSM